MVRIKLLLDSCVYYSAQEMRTPAGLAQLERPDDLEVYDCEVGCGMLAVGTMLQQTCLDFVRESLAAGVVFSVQFTQFIHRGEPYIATAIWVPYQTGCCRGFVRHERLTDFFGRVGQPIAPSTELLAVQAALEELSIEENLQTDKLLVVTCNLGPTTWSVYERRVGENDLSTVVAPELTNAGLENWSLDIMDPVFEALQSLAVLATSDQYLGLVLSSHGVRFSNLPTDQSVLYWPFVNEAVKVILKNHEELAQLVASGGTAGDELRTQLADQLEDGGFLARCRLVGSVAKPLGEALAAMAATRDLVGYLTPILDVLNWLRHELTHCGPESVRGVCWDALFDSHGVVLDLEKLRRSLPCLRKVSARALEMTDQELFTEMQEVLLDLYEAWCRKFREVLTSPAARILLLPLYRVQHVLASAQNLEEWATVALGTNGGVQEAIKAVRSGVGMGRPLGTALLKELVSLSSPLGTIIGMALVANW